MRRCRGRIYEFLSMVILHIYVFVWVIMEECKFLGMDNDLHMHVVLSICSHNYAIIYGLLIIHHSAHNYYFIFLHFMQKDKSHWYWICCCTVVFVHAILLG